MSEISIVMNMEGKAPEIVQAEGLSIEKLTSGIVVAMGALPRGMQSGKTSVGFIAKIDTETEPRPAYIEISLKFLQLATAMLTAEYGDETDGQTAFLATFDPNSPRS